MRVRTPFIRMALLGLLAFGVGVWMGGCAVVRPELGDSADVDSLSDSDSDDADGIAELDTESERVGDVENPDVEEDAPDLEEPNSEEDEGPEEDSDFDPESTSDSDPESTTDLDRNEPDAESEDAEACACSTNDECCDGCQARPMDSACDDGNPCTDDDRCRAGRCVGTPTPESRACDDDDPISRDDRCAAGRCTGSPKVEWVVRSHGVGSISAVVVDAHGNTYVTGSYVQRAVFGFGGLETMPAPYDRDYLAKFDPEGHPVWLRGDPYNARDQPIWVSVQAMGVDDSGRVYIAGGGLVYRFDALGRLVWSKAIAGTRFSWDSAGNTFVAGRYRGSVNIGGEDLGVGVLDECDYGLYVGKFDPDGRHIWSKTIVPHHPWVSDADDESYESRDRCDSGADSQLEDLRVGSNGDLTLLGSVSVGCANLGETTVCSDESLGTSYVATFTTDGRLKSAVVLEWQSLHFVPTFAVATDSSVWLASAWANNGTTAASLFSARLDPVFGDARPRRLSEPPISTLRLFRANVDEGGQLHLTGDSMETMSIDGHSFDSANGMTYSYFLRLSLAMAFDGGTQLLFTRTRSDSQGSYAVTSAVGPDGCWHVGAFITGEGWAAHVDRADSPAIATNSGCFVLRVCVRP